MTTIALPSIRGALRRDATYLVTTSTLVALTASADVVDEDAVTGPDPVHPRTDCLDHARRLMPADHSLIGLRTKSKMLSVEGT
jgi:hypothetical protein